MDGQTKGLTEQMERMFIRETRRGVGLERQLQKDAEKTQTSLAEFGQRITVEMPRDNNLKTMEERIKGLEMRAMEKGPKKDGSRQEMPGAPFPGERSVQHRPLRIGAADRAQNRAGARHQRPRRRWRRLSPGASASLPACVA